MDKPDSDLVPITPGEISIRAWLEGGCLEAPVKLKSPLSCWVNARSLSRNSCTMLSGNSCRTALAE